jgi:hypothetical protein
VIGPGLLGLLGLLGCGAGEPARPADSPPTGCVPGAADLLYDGLDADCLPADDYDGDGDGQTAQAFGGGDCDDANPTRYAGAPRICGNAVDDDCDLAPDCDLRGDVLLEDASAARFTGTPRSYAGGDLDMGESDGDGESDLLLIGDGGVNTTWLFRGPLLESRLAEEATFTYLGGSGGAALGDLDGDGLEDIAASTAGPFVQITTRVWLAGTPGWQSPDAQLIHQQGDALSSGETAIGDLDGDGIEDLVVSSRGGSLLDYEDTSGGYVMVFHGPLMGQFPSSDLDAVLIQHEVFAQAGVAMDPTSDLTGDGLNDLVVLDNMIDGGRAYVAESPLALETSFGDVAISVTAGESDFWVSAVATGDLDGDGQADLGVGSSNSNSVVRFGETQVILGPLAAGSVAEAVTIVRDTNADALAFPGDVDGDGEGDLLVQCSRSEARENHAELAYAPRGVVTADAFLVPASHNNGVHTVIRAGDLDSDGLADLVLGSQAAELEGEQVGGAWVILGRETGY